MLPKVIEIRQVMVPRLSSTALLQLEAVEQLAANTQLSQEPDKRISVFSKANNGLDSGAIYQLLKARGQPNDARSSFIWRNSAPPRVQMFMWLLVQQRIQSRTVLAKKHVLHNSTCEVCHEQEETPDHIISGCAISKLFWQKLDMSYMLQIEVTNLHTAEPPAGLPKQEFAAFVALSCWHLWKARNATVFRGERPSAAQIIRNCKEAAEQWRHRFSNKKKHIVDQWCNALEMAANAQ
jgi:hypothetical protein